MVPKNPATSSDSGGRLTSLPRKVANNVGNSQSSERREHTIIYELNMRRQRLIWWWEQHAMMLHCIPLLATIAKSRLFPPTVHILLLLLLFLSRLFGGRLKRRFRFLLLSLLLGRFRNGG